MGRNKFLLYGKIFCSCAPQQLCMVDTSNQFSNKTLTKVVHCTIYSLTLNCNLLTSGKIFCHTQLVAGVPNSYKSCTLHYIQSYIYSLTNFVIIIIVSIWYIIIINIISDTKLNTSMTYGKNFCRTAKFFAIHSTTVIAKDTTTITIVSLN